MKDRSFLLHNPQWFILAASTNIVVFIPPGTVARVTEVRPPTRVAKKILIPHQFTIPLQFSLDPNCGKVGWQCRPGSEGVPHVDKTVWCIHLGGIQAESLECYKVKRRPMISKSSTISGISDDSSPTLHTRVCIVISVRIIGIQTK